MKSLSLILLMFTNVALADVNVMPGLPSGIKSVDGSACVATGGKISTKANQKYSMCVGGKYDGLISAMNSEERDCEQIIDTTISLLASDNSVDDEQEFLGSAASAIDRCIFQTKPFGTQYTQTVNSVKKLCVASSDQASGLYLGHCYLRAAQFVTFVIQQ